MRSRMIGHDGPRSNFRLHAVLPLFPLDVKEENVKILDFLFLDGIKSFNQMKFTNSIKFILKNSIFKVY